MPDDAQPARESSVESRREQAKALLRHLAGAEPDTLNQAKALVEALRNDRQYDLMGSLAEAVSRQDPDDAKNRRLYAQCLIETGKATAAIDLLKPLERRLRKGHPERAEAAGLLGRAYKQIFFDAGDKTSDAARDALKRAIEVYRGPYEEDARNTWHGVNLVALLTRARRLGLRVARDLTPRDVATRVVATLEATPENRRDEWFLPTLAEACLGLDDWSRVEAATREYADLSRHDTPAFLIASTLRQFTQVWDLEQVDERGRSLVNILRARLASMPDGVVELTPDAVRRLQAMDRPPDSQLQAVLGPGGLKTYQWWATGCQRAASVASIRRRLGTRVGTGFLVRSGDLGLEPAAELVLLTNYHVVNPGGESPGIRPDQADVTFEASGTPATFTVGAILWSSPVAQHDASVLRLVPAPTGVAPLPIASDLPATPGPPPSPAKQVYVIGHPSGGDLSFSFRGNDLLDHEGPPGGMPQIAGVCRVHYTATTERGSSGSPVFDDGAWDVIALHHSGDKSEMQKLNGKDGLYGANEGISLPSIKAAPKG